MHPFASTLWTGTLTVLVLAVIQDAAFPATPLAPEVSRWQPHDFAFTATLSEGNPFLVGFAATVHGPDGKTFRVPGFYDGGDAWKVRVSPTSEGQWSLVTESDLAALDGKEATFTCVPNLNPNVHGGLRVDSAHPHHFVFEDGTRHFLLGYECDWLWALDMNDPALPTVNAFLDKLTLHGFNHVILNSYAHDTGWCKGTTGDQDYGPPLLYAWEGSNDRPDHSRLRLAYWQHYDRVIEAMYRRGVTAHVLMKVYNKMVNWPPKGSVEDDLFFRWLIARYAAYMNGLDVDLFVDAVLYDPFNTTADINRDGAVTGLDVDPFVAALLGEDGSLQQIPEPSTLLLCIIGVGVVGEWRKWCGLRSSMN